MDETTQELMALERAAMEGWLAGDPGPSLAICDPEVTTFFLGLDSRLDGLAALTAFYEPFRGKKLFGACEFSGEKAQRHGDTAVLTYYLDWQADGKKERWNSTQVYHRTGDGWRVVHSHWSKTGR